MRNNIIKIRIILWLILAAVIAWLAILKIVPSGRISYVFDFKKPSYFIGKLAPAERVKTGDGQAVIKGGPVYFSLFTPRRFDKARITITFKNTTAYPVMELGPLIDKAAYSYALKPLQNKIIDQLSLVWPAVNGQNGAKLYQREKKYGSLEKFLAALASSPKLADETALYDYNLKNKFLLDNYTAPGEKTLIDYKLRGSYQFYTYVKGRSLEDNFTFTDLNLNQGPDPVDIKVYSGEGLIYSTRVSDDQPDSRERSAAVKLPNLPEGVYRVGVIAGDDIITDSIVTSQNKFALINKAWLAEGNKKNLALYTDSRLVNAQTSNPASLGGIKVGDKALDLTETYRQFSLPVSNRPAKLELAKDDITISGDGVFSLTPEGLINPELKSADGNIDINAEGVNYVLSNYETPANSTGWQTAAAEFDLAAAYREKNKYQFQISIPGHKAEDDNSGSVEIKEIKAELFGSSLKQKIIRYYENIF